MSLRFDVPDVEVGRYIGKNGDLVIDNTPGPVDPGYLNGVFSIGNGN